MNFPATEKIEFRKVRDLQDHINVTASYIRQNAIPMLKIGLQVAGIYLVLGLAALIGAFYFGFIDFMDVFAENNYDEIGDVNYGLLGGLFFIGMILFMIASVFYTATGYRYILEYIEREDYNYISISDIKRSLGNDSRIIFTTYLWLFLGVIVFSFAFVLVAVILEGAGSGGVFIGVLGVFTMFGALIYLMIPLSLLFVVRFHENLGFWDATKRCMNLMKDYWGETLGLYFIVSIILYTISAVPSVFSNVGLSIGEMVGSDMVGFTIFGVFYVLSIAVSFITGMAFSILVCFRYFSLLEIKEGVHMLDKIEGLGDWQEE